MGEPIDVASHRQACDRLCAEVNSSASAGDQRRLFSAELKARGLEVFSSADPEILRAVQLPDFRASGRPLWPPKAPSLATIYAASMAVPYHPGGNWADPEVQRRFPCWPTKLIARGHNTNQSAPLFRPRLA